MSNIKRDIHGNFVCGKCGATGSIDSPKFKNEQAVRGHLRSCTGIRGVMDHATKAAKARAKLGVELVAGEANPVTNPALSILSKYLPEESKTITVSAPTPAAQSSAALGGLFSTPSTATTQSMSSDPELKAMLGDLLKAQALNAQQAQDAVNAKHIAEKNHNEHLMGLENAKNDRLKMLLWFALGAGVLYLVIFGRESSTPVQASAALGSAPGPSGQNEAEDCDATYQDVLQSSGDRAKARHERRECILFNQKILKGAFTPSAATARSQPSTRAQMAKKGIKLGASVMGTKLLNEVTASIF